MPRLFPSPHHNNIVISATGIGASKEFSVLVMNSVPNYHTLDTAQCFPLYWYEKAEEEKGKTGEMFESTGGQADADGYIRHDAVTDWSLGEFRKKYNDEKISKEDIFYYVYGLLHSEEYRDKYESSLKRSLPRMPYVKEFWKFSKAGRELAEWHLNYETVEPYPLQEQAKELGLDPKSLYRVEKMVFAKNNKEVDKTIIIINSKLRLAGIPLEAYEYVVNGKPALEWIMERYAVSVEKDSGIRNDPNNWSDNPRYIVDLVKRVTRVSIETMRIVKSLPPL
jgi:predicted helicase